MLVIIKLLRNTLLIILFVLIGQPQAFSSTVIFPGVTYEFEEGDAITGRSYFGFTLWMKVNNPDATPPPYEPNVSFLKLFETGHDYTRINDINYGVSFPNVSELEFASSANFDFMKLDQIARLPHLRSLIFQLETQFHELNDEQIHEFLQLQHLKELVIWIWSDDFSDSILKTRDLLKQLLPNTQVKLRVFVRGTQKSSLRLKN